MDEKGIFPIDFPPYSPDINPIENVWNHLNRRVEQRNSKDRDTFTADIEVEWKLTNNSFLEKLVDRCQRDS